VLLPVLDASRSTFQKNVLYRRITPHVRRDAGTHEVVIV
jgi:hypothetical protein